jgi:hypothetical protein
VCHYPIVFKQLQLQKLMRKKIRALTFQLQFPDRKYRRFFRMGDRSLFGDQIHRCGTVPSLSIDATTDDDRFIPASPHFPSHRKVRQKSMFGENPSSPLKRRFSKSSGTLNSSTKVSPSTTNPSSSLAVTSKPATPSKLSSSTHIINKNINANNSSPTAVYTRTERRATNLGLFYGILSEATRQNQHMARFKGRCLIIPHSWFRRLWDILSLILLTYVAIFTPVQIAFYGEAMSMSNWYEWPIVFTMDRIVDVIFIIDIFFNFRTAWVNKQGEIEFDQATASMEYLTGWFFLDAVSW